MDETEKNIEKDTLIEEEPPTLADIKPPQPRQTPQLQLRKDTLIGKTIAGRFSIVQKIGTGGMGAVYKAKQKGMDRWVAVKVMHKEYTYDEKILKRFEVEALAASRLNHPNTIRIYDFGKTEDNTLYIAMEYLEGKSLASVIKKEGAIAVERVLYIASSVCKSLMEAHEKGVIHRDLKPDNIFLCQVGTEKDFVKVLDFGLAKLREVDKSYATLTQAGTIFGTPKYMAPEQCKSVAQVDHRADIYSLGVVLFESLMGKPPFEGENPLSILIQHVQEAPPPFRIKRPDIEVPSVVEEFVMKALKKDVSQRFQTVTEMLAEVEKLRAGLEGKFSRIVYFQGRRPLEMDITRLETETAFDTKIEAPFKKKISPIRLSLYAISILIMLFALSFGYVYFFLPEPLPLHFKKIVRNKFEIAVPQSELIQIVNISINSEPSGAEVFKGEEILGKTPLSFNRIKENKKEDLRIFLDGYKGENITIDTSLSRTFEIKLQKLEEKIEGKPPRYVKFEKDKEAMEVPVEKVEEMPLQPKKPPFEKVQDIKKSPYNK